MLFAQTDPSGLTGWIFDVIETFGGVGLAFLNVIDTFFPPIPSEIFLPVGGYLASQDQLNPFSAWAGATIGSLVGAVLLYEIGRRVGRERVDAFIGHIPLMHGEDLERADDWFERHGTSSVLLGRLVPGVRSLVSLPAGVAGMSRPRFAVLTTVGSGVWNAALILAGWMLGERWHQVDRYSSWIDLALVAAAVLAVVRFVWKRRDRIGEREDDTRQPESTPQESTV